MVKKRALLIVIITQFIFDCQGAQAPKKRKLSTSSNSSATQGAPIAEPVSEFRASNLLKCDLKRFLLEQDRGAAPYLYLKKCNYTTGKPEHLNRHKSSSYHRHAYNLHPANIRIPLAAVIEQAINQQKIEKNQSSTQGSESDRSGDEGEPISSGSSLPSSSSCASLSLSAASSSCSSSCSSSLSYEPQPAQLQGLSSLAAQLPVASPNSHSSLSFSVNTSCVTGLPMLSSDLSNAQLWGQAEYNLPGQSPTAPLMLPTSVYQADSPLQLSVWDPADVLFGQILDESKLNRD